MAIYTAQFRPTDVGIAGILGFPIFQKLSDGSVPTNPAPTVFTEIGLGLYKFTYVAAEEVAFVLDGGAAIPNTSRYVSGVLSPVDTNLDAPVSVVQATVTQLRRLSEGRWKIWTTGPDANKLVLYSADGLTVLQKWNLLDNLGNPTTSNIFERVPQSLIP